MAEAVSSTMHEQDDKSCGCKSPSRSGTSAREILDRRYASGEITRDQYEQMKQDIGGTAKSKKGCC